MVGSHSEFGSVPASCFHQGAQADDGLVPSQRGGLDGDAAVAAVASHEPPRQQAACGADGANVIYDGIGGDYTEAALRAIAWQGRHLVVGFTAGIPKLPLNLALLKGCDIKSRFRFRMALFITARTATRYGAAHVRSPWSTRPPC